MSLGIQVVLLTWAGGGACPVNVVDISKVLPRTCKQGSEIVLRQGYSLFVSETPDEVNAKLLKVPL